MARWHNIRVRGDLYERLAARADAGRCSRAQMVDALLTQALMEQSAAQGVQQIATSLMPQSAASEIDLSEKIKNLEPSAPPSVWGRGRETISPAPQIEGQMTVDEMLASCPQCAGELRDVVAGVVDGRTVTAQGCVDCGWVREPK
jgi:hypothetical protein